MEYFPAPLEKLVEQFARLPGIGGKSAQRRAFKVRGLPEAEAEAFAGAILDAKRSVTCCPVCQNFTAGGLCPICASPKRDGSVICVVADPRDVAAIERAREYGGHYHVLHGVLSPMNHVGPDDLAIKPLLDRVADHTAGLRDPRGRSSGICRRRHPHAGAGRTKGYIRKRRAERLFFSFKKARCLSKGVFPVTGP